MTKSNDEIEAAVESIEACLADDEDGAGYLFDLMQSDNGKTILHALRNRPEVVSVDDIFKKIFAHDHLIGSVGDYFLHAARHYPYGLLIKEDKS